MITMLTMNEQMDRQSNQLSTGLWLARLYPAEHCDMCGDPVSGQTETQTELKPWAEILCTTRITSKYLARFPRNGCRLWRRFSSFIQMKLLRYAFVLKIRILVKVLTTAKQRPSVLEELTDWLSTYAQPSYISTNQFTVDKMHPAQLILLSGFVQTLKHCFPGLVKTKFQGFPGLKTRFQGLSRIHSIHKHGCMRSKSAHTKSVFNATALQ